VSAQAAPKAPVEAPEPAGSSRREAIAGGDGADADADGWALLENLRRRLEDQAAQTRRTQQQVSQLAESIGALVEVQRRRSRWLNLNSFVAYLIFTMLCGAGAYLLYQSRADMLAGARDAAQRERDLAVRRADEAAARAAAREQADAAAWEVYQLLDAGKRTEAEQQLAALGELPLSRTERAILAARAHETKVQAVEAALKAAAASLKAGRHAEVIAPLEAALVSEPTGARAALARYYLGVAYAKGSQLEKAVAHLQGAVDGGAASDDARFQLASALDRGGAYARARAEYDRFATAHPQSPLAVFAMRRSATLARMPPVAPGAAGIFRGAGAGVSAAGAGAPGTGAGVPPTGAGAGVPPTGAGVPGAGAGVPPTGAGGPPTGSGAGVPATGAGVPATGAGVPPTGAGVPGTGAGVPGAGAGVPPTGAGAGVPPTGTGAGAGVPATGAAGPGPAPAPKTPQPPGGPAPATMAPSTSPAGAGSAPPPAAPGAPAPGASQPSPPAAAPAPATAP
jgi:hypothetical protein